MNTIKFKVEGMHCDQCAQRIQSLLEKERGVRTAKVSFHEKEARILYDDKTVGENQLASAIEKAGYRVLTRVLEGSR